MSIAQLLESLAGVELKQKERDEKTQAIREAAGIGKDFEQMMDEIGQVNPDHYHLIMCTMPKLYQAVNGMDFPMYVSAIIECLPESVARAMFRYYKGMLMGQINQMETILEAKFAPKKEDTNQEAKEPEKEV